jgi:hypothetical protein
MRQTHKLRVLAVVVLALAQELTQEVVILSRLALMSVGLMLAILRLAQPMTF